MTKLTRRKAKYAVRQVVSVRSFSGPGFAGRRGWHQFGKIVKIVPPRIPPMKKTAPFCYFLDGWMSAIPEQWLRRLSQSEIGRQKRRKP